MTPGSMIQQHCRVLRGERRREIDARAGITYVPIQSTSPATPIPPATPLRSRVSSRTRTTTPSGHAQRRLCTPQQNQRRTVAATSTTPVTNAARQENSRSSFSNAIILPPASGPKGGKLCPWWNGVCIILIIPPRMNSPDRERRLLAGSVRATWRRPSFSNTMAQLGSAVGAGADTDTGAMRPR